MKWPWLTLFLILAGGVLAWARWADGAANHGWKTVERLVGYPGQRVGDGFKISVPRSDLNVLVHGAWVDPRAGLASWFAFQPLAHGSLLMGELVLVDWEVPRIEALLESHHFTLTSIYRPFNGENPGIERIGFMGTGLRVFLAQEIRDLLDTTSMPLTGSSSSLPMPSAAQRAFGLPIEKILGPSQWDGGAFQFTFVSTEPATNGVEMPSYMGFETTFYFQPDGKKAKVYGQWVLSREEAQKVMENLMKNRVVITNTHSLLLDLSSQRVFIDFWTEGNPVSIAKVLEEALSQTKLTGCTLNSFKESE